MNNLRQREKYEDMFHDIVCKMLPKFKRSNIRPTYQKKPGKMYDNTIEDGKVTSVDGFTNGANIIYISATFDADVLTPNVEDDGSVDITRNFSIHFYIYGDQSQEVALIIYSLIRSNFVLDELNKNGIFLETTSGINQMYEEINGEIWERRDLECRFNENVSIPLPTLDKVAIIGDDGVEVSVGK